MSFLGFLEFLPSSLDGVSFVTGGGSLPSLFVGLVPFGTLKSFVLSKDIIELVLDVIHVLVVDVDSVLGLLDVLNLIGFTPLFEGFSEVSDDLGAFNLFPGLLDVLDGILDLILVFDLDLEEVHLLLPLLWNVSDLNVLLESVLEFPTFLSELLSC